MSEDLALAEEEEGVEGAPRIGSAAGCGWGGEVVSEKPMREYRCSACFGTGHIEQEISVSCYDSFNPDWSGAKQARCDNCGGCGHVFVSEVAGAIVHGNTSLSDESRVAVENVVRTAKERFA